MSHGQATLAELQTFYSLSDVYDMLEIISVDAHNEQVIRRRN